MDLGSVLTFVLASLILLVLPGPGVLYVVTRTLTDGLATGLVSALGLATGVLAHVVAAAVGVSALLLASAHAFALLKLIGAAYLIYLGIRTLLSKGSSGEAKPAESVSRSRAFVDGIIVSVFNPKIAVFFVAYIPQFINPDHGSVAMQFVMLGVLYAALAVCTDGAYALIAARLRRQFGARFFQGQAPRLLGGSVFVLLGASLALAEKRN